MRPSNSCEVALDKITKRWKLDDVVSNDGKPSELYYIVRLRKNTTRDEFLTAIRADGREQHRIGRPGNQRPDAPGKASAGEERRRQQNDRTLRLHLGPRYPARRSRLRLPGTQRDARAPTAPCSAAREARLEAAVSSADTGPIARWILPAQLNEISGVALTTDGRILAHGDQRGAVFAIDYRRGGCGEGVRPRDAEDRP